MADKYILAIQREVAGKMVHEQYFHTAAEALSSMRQGGPDVYLIKLTRQGFVHDRNGVRVLTQDLIGRRTDAWDQGVLAMRQRRAGRYSVAPPDSGVVDPVLLETLRLSECRGY